MKAKKQKIKKTTVAPKSAITDKKQLPKMIEEALYAQFGSDLNGEMAEQFKLTIGQTAKMTFLIDGSRAISWLALKAERVLPLPVACQIKPFFWVPRARFTSAFTA